ncbi:uncharacterized protein LAESUDRAFT_759392 [Laetiporus sulphureus 93-53]|uniref:Uncharacterized protein n=1 Tax=Laetiporus sulphureus 93-53 TaxID=1314785 RepID=A0A165EA57_9APHY|nr:uncharacterized protein LAESUDRAFT_759392 [Laetiporus sulphureus 93-53]KZT06571.1 hypothetical protein LAESUDRAFT_759392 [Laetiporus sulphureus 93-53]
MKDVSAPELSSKIIQPFIDDEQQCLQPEDEDDELLLQPSSHITSIQTEKDEESEGELIPAKEENEESSSEMSKQISQTINFNLHAFCRPTLNLNPSK